MADDVILPSLGQTTTELTIIEWFKQDGDRINKGDLLLEVETDKAVVPVEAFAEGILKDIRYAAGDLVEVGSVLAVIVSAQEAEVYGKASVEKTAEAPLADDASSSKAVIIAEGSNPFAAVPVEYILASPQAKQMARDHGVELKDIAISRADSIIKAQDIENHLQKQQAAKPLSSVVNRIETKARLSKMRKTIAERLTQSKQTIPHFYVTVHVDVSDLVRMREDLKHQLQTDASYNSFIFKACAHALLNFPIVNSSIKDDCITSHSEVNIGLAVEVEDGLRVPVIRNVENHSVRELTGLLKETAERARTGRLNAVESSGGTFTISSLGGAGIDEFAAIINPPEAAILAVGRISKRPFVYGDEVKSGMGLSLTLSVDHRIIDGAVAGRFLQSIRDMLEHPHRLLML